MEFRDLLLGLVLVWLAAKVAGEAMERIGQTAVLGELLAGVLIGPGVLGLVHESDVLHALAEFGVLILLFEVGLESDLAELLRAGLQAALVALVGVAVPFAVGYGVMQWLGHPALLAVFVGATFTATSVGYHGAGAGRPRSPPGRRRQGGARRGGRGRHPRADHPGGRDRGRADRKRLPRRGRSALGERPSSSWSRPSWSGSGSPRRWSAGSDGCGRAARSSSTRWSSRSALAVVADLIGLATHHRRVRGRADPGHDRTTGAHRGAHQAGRRPSRAGVLRHRRDEGPARGAESVRRGRQFGGAMLLTAVAVASKLAAGLAVYQRGVRRWPVAVGMVPRGEVGLIFAGAGLAAGVVAGSLLGTRGRRHADDVRRSALVEGAVSRLRLRAA